MPAGQLSSLLALSGHLRPGSQLSRHLKEGSASPTPRRQTSSLLTVFAKCPEHTTMKLTPHNHLFSTTIKYHPKKVYISKPPRRNKKGIGCKKKKSSINYKTEWESLGPPNKAHHFQVYSAAVASAANIAINDTPLVISPTKEDSTSDPGPQNLSQQGWV